MPTYAEIRQQVLAQLPPAEREGPDGLAAGPRAVLQGIAHAAVCGDAQRAALDLVTSGRDWDLSEAAMAVLAAQFADVIAACAAETTRQIAAGLASGSPPAAVEAAVWTALWVEFIHGRC